MTVEPIVVFLNDRPVRVRHEATLAELLADAAPELRAALDAGLAWATDGRGVPITGDAGVTPGAIFRVQRRARASGNGA